MKHANTYKEGIARVTVNTVLSCKSSIAASNWSTAPLKFSLFSADGDKSLHFSMLLLGIFPAQRQTHIPGMCMTWVIVFGAFQPLKGFGPHSGTSHTSKLASCLQWISTIWGNSKLMPALLMSLLPHCQNHYLLAHQEHETLKVTHHCNHQSFVVMAAVDGGGSKISLS